MPIPMSAARKYISSRKVPSDLQNCNRYLYIRTADRLKQHVSTLSRADTYVASELATDIVVNVGDIKFHLHMFPLLCKCSCLVKLVSNINRQTTDEVIIPDIPGGPGAFEICAKFCYGITVTLNAHNVVAVRCAAEYLGMHETMEKGNLVYKIDVFLNSVIFWSWKESIVVLQTTKAMLPWSEDFDLINHCIESIAFKAASDPVEVDWCYTYNRKNRPELVPKDWWVEDLCELEIEMYRRVLSAIKREGIICNEVVGEALKTYAYRKFPVLITGEKLITDLKSYRIMVDTVIGLLPDEKGSVSCSFLLKLWKAAIFVDCSEKTEKELIKKIGHQLEQATVGDLLIPAPEGDCLKYDVNIVQNIVVEFLNRDRSCEIESLEEDEVKQPDELLSEASKVMVAKTMDSYLAEIARDPNLPVSKFIELSEMLSSISRPRHDGLYRAIDMYLKEHPGLSKSDTKAICRLMDCNKLSVEACKHAVQNDRLPMRVILQVLFFELVRASATSETSTPDLPKSVRELKSGSKQSSRSPGDADEDWENALKGELATLKLERNASEKTVDKNALHKMKGSRKILSKICGEISGSDSTDSIISENPEDSKSTYLKNRRFSVS